MESGLEWFIYQLNLEPDGWIKDLIQKAKEMEKQQRISDFIAGCNACGFEHSAEDWAKEYFENKHKSE